jgi:hypothetical protein
MSARCRSRSSASVVHRCPSQPTYWRSSAQIAHAAGGAAAGWYWAPQVTQTCASCSFSDDPSTSPSCQSPAVGIERLVGRRALPPIFPLRVRSAAMSVSTVANWGSNFLVSTFFLTLTGAITTQGTFWLYAGFGVAAILFFAWRLPETKNRTLEETSEEVSDEAVEA